ncbi:MAG: hypothetical protein FWC56_02970 [Phycisphaerae bacterium]|nr:hypothetical protein [Phycisphaerae bacterium]
MPDGVGDAVPTGDAIGTSFGGHVLFIGAVTTFRQYGHATDEFPHASSTSIGCWHAGHEKRMAIDDSVDQTPCGTMSQFRSIILMQSIISVRQPTDKPTILCIGKLI